MSAYAIVLGGGSGTRMKTEINKVLLPLRGVPVIVRAIAPFSGLCAGAVVVTRAEELEEMADLLARYGLGKFVKQAVAGGDTRQASVAAGLAALPEEADVVLVHDGARPMVDEEMIRRVLASVEAHGSGVASVPVIDTIKRADGSGKVLETLERSELRAMQTPQGFKKELLMRAHASAGNVVATDDAALVERMGEPVYLCEGSRENLKLTTPVDLALAEAILKARLEESVL